MTFLDLALSYVARGWYVFPLQTRGKFPRIPKADGGRGFKDATLDLEQVTSWWTKWPNANVGIACGASGLYVVDCDLGLTSWEDFEAWRMRNGIPVTFTVRTGRRTSYAVQMYFEGAVKCIGAWKLDGCSGEIRSLGGYVMAIGNIHPDTGEKYTLVVDAPLAGRPPIFEASLVTASARMQAGPHDPLIRLGKGEGRTPRMMQVLGSCFRAKLPKELAIAALVELNETEFRDPIPLEKIEAAVESCYAKWPEPEDTPPKPTIGGKKVSDTPTEVDTSEDAEALADSARPIYPDWVWDKTFYGEFAELCTEGNYIPKRFFSEAVRTVVGAIVGNRLSCTIYGANARSFTILITNPGGGKGTACDYTRDLFAERWEGLKTSQEPPLLFGSKEYAWRTRGIGAQILNPASAPGLMKALEPRKRAKDEQVNPLEEWNPIPRAVTIMEEVRGLFANFANETTGAGLESVICELYDRTSYSSTATKDRQPVSGELMYSLLGGITKEGWDAVFGKLESTESGFLSRVNIIGTEDPRRVAGLESPDFGPLRNRLLPFIGALADKPVKLSPTPEAREIVSDWFNSLILAEGIQKSRLNIHAWRVALHRAWLFGHDAITEQDAFAGCAVADFQARMREYYAPPEGETRGARCEASIRKVMRARRRMTLRDLRKATHYERFGIDTWDKALKALERAGEIRLQVSPRSIIAILLRNKDIAAPQGHF